MVIYLALKGLVDNFFLILDCYILIKNFFNFNIYFHVFWFIVCWEDRLNRWIMYINIICTNIDIIYTKYFCFFFINLFKYLNIFNNFFLIFIENIFNNFLFFKVFVILSLLIFTRGGTPRYRFDYLTKLGWLKFLGSTLFIFIFIIFLFFLI